jgi:hypothetical protein
LSADAFEGEDERVNLDADPTEVFRLTRELNPEPDLDAIEPKLDE